MIELSRLTISDGVPFGKNIPYQLPISRPGTNVLIVGRSGKERFFSAVVTARQRTRPVLSAAAATGPVANSMSISPVISPVIDGPPPVKATINVSRPANCASISAARWLVLPGVLTPLISLPGFFLARASNSFTDLAGTLGWMHSTFGAFDTRVDGTRSFWVSNLSVLE